MRSAPTIAIVDDDEAVRDSLDALLSAAGHQTACFGTGNDFLDHCDREGLACLYLLSNLRRQ